MADWKNLLNIAVSGDVPEDQLSPYIKILSLPMVSRWHDRAIVIDWQASADSHQGSGMVFGGYISALADYAAGSAMLMILENTDIFFTKKLEIEYKRPFEQRKSPSMLR
jgi:acyl-coenzyme A thioesterase PaaI-like protein